MPYSRTTYRRRARRPATQAQVQAWADEHANNALALDQLVAHEQAGTLNSFTADILRKLRLYGSLSERQVAAVLRGFERDAEWAARRAAEAEALADVPPVAEGQRRIEGEIVSAKVKTTRFGWVAKMLVREADGNKVWGSIPRTLLDPQYHDGQNYTGSDETLQPFVGSRIAIVATVRRSDDDTHFGFFSRPRVVPCPATLTPPAATEVLAPAYTPEPERPHIYVHGVGRIEQADCGHFPHPGDNGFCETCAEAAIELQGAEYGEDL